MVRYDKLISYLRKKTDKELDAINKDMKNRKRCMQKRELATLGCAAEISRTVMTRATVATTYLDEKSADKPFAIEVRITYPSSIDLGFLQESVDKAGELLQKRDLHIRKASFFNCVDSLFNDEGTALARNGITLVLIVVRSTSDVQNVILSLAGTSNDAHV